jgi:hypothetical protein
MWGSPSSRSNPAGPGSRAFVRSKQLMLAGREVRTSRVADQLSVPASLLLLLLPPRLLMVMLRSAAMARSVATAAATESWQTSSLLLACRMACLKDQ